MTTSEKHWQALAEAAEKMALASSEQGEESHAFSEDYQQRKAAFLRDEAEEKRLKKYRKRLIAIVAGLLIGIPTTVFAAKQLYDFVVEKENYEVKVSVKQHSADTSISQEEEVFYKLSLGYVPDGMSDFNEQGMKYWYEDNYGMGGFSFLLWKVNEQADFSELFVASYQEVNFGEHQGVITTTVENESDMSRHAYVLFAEEGFMLEVYVGNDVPEIELMKVLSNVRLEATTAEQGTVYQDYDDLKTMDQQREITVKPLVKTNPQLLGVGEKVALGNVNFTIETVEVRQSIAGLELANFYSSMLERLYEREMIDEAGNLIPYERLSYQRGDGKNTIDQVIDRKWSQPKLVYLTATLESLSNHPIEDLFMQNRLTLLTETKGGWTYASEDMASDPGLLSSEIDYLDSHGEGKGYYRLPTIAPKEKRVIHFGYFIDEAQLSQMFLDSFSYGGVTDYIDDLNASDRWWIDIRQ